MDTSFIEEIKDDVYRIAVIDRHRIFSASNPGTLATIYECSLTNPTAKDDAEIFHALAPAIGADDFLVDLIENYRSQKLNSWSIATLNSDVDNIFLAVEPLTRSHRLELYSTRYSITPDNGITSTSHSLFSLVAFSDQQKWKTGILQECIDRLVKLEYRRNPRVYSVIDEQYRRLLRFKIETEATSIENDDIRIRTLFIRRLISLLGLKNSHDTTTFTTIPDAVTDVLHSLIKLFPTLCSDDTLINRLSHILTKWSGAAVVQFDRGYRLHVDATVTEGLTYMQPLLLRPSTLIILDAPM